MIRRLPILEQKDGTLWWIDLRLLQVRTVATEGPLDFIDFANEIELVEWIGENGRIVSPMTVIED